MTEETGGFFMPGSVTIREPIWDNWIGRLLMKRFGIYREREDNMYKRMMDELRGCHIEGVDDDQA